MFRFAGDIVRPGRGSSRAASCSHLVPATLPQTSLAHPLSHHPRSPPTPCPAHPPGLLTPQQDSNHKEGGGKEAHKTAGAVPDHLRAKGYVIDEDEAPKVGPALGASICYCPCLAVPFLFLSLGTRAEAAANGWAICCRSWLQALPLPCARLPTCWTPARCLPLPQTRIDNPFEALMLADD